MQSVAFSDFELLLLRSQNQLGTSVLLVLAWLAASDGSISDAEAKQLTEISLASKHGHETQALINVARKRDHDALQLACELVMQHFRGEKAKLFLGMAIGIAIADGYLLPTENYILRFLADMLEIPRGELNKVFVDVTGKDMPEPSDPSKLLACPRKHAAATAIRRLCSTVTGAYFRSARSGSHQFIRHSRAGMRRFKRGSKKRLSAPRTGSSPRQVFYIGKRIRCCRYEHVSEDQRSLRVPCKLCVICMRA